MRRVQRAYRDAMREDALAFRAADLALLGAGAGAGAEELLRATGSPVSEPVGGAVSDASSVTTAATGNAASPSSKKSDPEFFLPRDSPLRSLNGELARPALVPFDYATFLQTTSVEYWRQNFVQDGHDRILTETAEAVVSHICLAQASKELRVRHGSAPLGRFWRAKREHITPLALTMHELKLWATNRLRVANVSEEGTHLEISRRIKYVQALQKKEAWGPSAAMLRRGMRPIAHDKLFRLLLTTREDLARARDYAFRGYCRRRSREKLGRLENLLKNAFLGEMRLLSALLTVTERVSEPSAKRLQPTDLLNSAHNQTFVDYSNVLNVCLRALVDVTLVRQCLLSDFAPGSASVSGDESDPVAEIARWPSRNLFCARFNGVSAGLLEERDVSPAMPAAYAPTAQRVAAELKATGDKKAAPPPAVKAQAAAWKKAWGDDAADASSVMRLALRTLAALQDAVPCMYAVHELYSMAGDGGDFTLYDTLRDAVIQTMGDAIARVYTLQAAERALVAEVQRLANEHQTKMEMRRLKTKKAEYEPDWLANLEYCHNEMLPLTRAGFADVFKQSQEIARDAWDYALTAAGFREKVDRCRATVDALLRGSGRPRVPASEFAGDFALSRVVDLRRADWLTNRADHAGSGSAPDPSALIPGLAAAPAEPVSETARYNLERAALEREAKALSDEFESGAMGAAYASSSSGHAAAAAVDFGLGGQDLDEEEFKALTGGANPFADGDDDVDERVEERTGNPFA